MEITEIVLIVISIGFVCGFVMSFLDTFHCMKTRYEVALEEKKMYMTIAAYYAKEYVDGGKICPSG